MTTAAQPIALSKVRARKLVDRGGEITSQMATLKKELETIKAELLKAGIEDLAGGTYEVTWVESHQVVLDSKKAKGLLTPAQIAACSSPRDCSHYKFKHR